MRNKSEGQIWETDMRRTNMRNKHAKNTSEAYMRNTNDKHAWKQKKQIPESYVRNIHEKHIWMRNIYKYTQLYSCYMKRFMRIIPEKHIWTKTKHTVCGLLRSKQTGRDAHGFTQGRLRHFQIAKILRAKTFHDASSWAERNNGNNQSVPSLFANVSASVRTHAFVKAFEKTIYAAYAPQTGHDKNSHRLSTSDSLLISHVGQVVKAVEILRFRCRFGLCRCSDNRWWLRR